MRSFPALAAVLAAAALAAAPRHAAAASVPGHLPIWAAFSFAVAAFHGPLR